MEQLRRFKADISDYHLPERFTFPFYYEPHPLCVQATKELQAELIVQQQQWKHNFGLVAGKTGTVLGKMFGVLVVQLPDATLGYLAAFSGKLVDGLQQQGFVPPVFDMFQTESFYTKGIAILESVNAQIEALEQDLDYVAAKQQLEQTQAKAAASLQDCKAKIKIEKKKRKLQRTEARAQLTVDEFEEFNEQLRQESIKQQYYLKDLIQYWDDQIQAATQVLQQFQAKIDDLKQFRKQKSQALQQQLFEAYQFLNIKGERKHLKAIFGSIAPPSGAGDCAAPRLLQYAFQHNLKPVCIAEFWWGAAPKSEIRKHQQFYPACRGKCEPILGHMLQGMAIDPNPMLGEVVVPEQLDIIYEDEVLLLLNKPTEFLSVPGKTIQDSVLYRLQKAYPKATGPLLVHRLDMSTSGLMLVAKEKVIHKLLQQQFIKRKIEKRYTALLEGIVKENKGTIDLPLRVDLNDRPRQLVCYEHGKAARTHWEVVESTNNRTKVYFYPVTGRTHQLRVHAAHHLGLNTPIVGDDLYGTKADRLYLHAERLAFQHPVSKEWISFEIAAEGW